MLTVKDLSASKEMDRKALAGVSGGMNVIGQGQGVGQTAFGGLVGANSSVANQFAYISDWDYDQAINVLSPFGVAVA